MATALGGREEGAAVATGVGGWPRGCGPGEEPDIHDAVDAGARTSPLRGEVVLLSGTRTGTVTAFPTGPGVAFTDGVGSWRRS